MKPADRSRALAIIAFALLMTGVPAAAQQSDTPGSRATSLPDSDDDERELDEVAFTIGMAGSVAPTYSGSDRTGYAIAPAGRIVWRGYSISTSSVARASSAVAGSNRSSETGLTGPLFRGRKFAFGFGASINRGRDGRRGGRAAGAQGPAWNADRAHARAVPLHVRTWL